MRGAGVPRAGSGAALVHGLISSPETFFHLVTLPLMIPLLHRVPL
jgi:hypothetical protein